MSIAITACASIAEIFEPRRVAVFGASDRQGAYPQANPVTPGDLAATLFDALGVPADTHFADSTNRPHRVTSGNPVMGLFG